MEHQWQQLHVKLKRYLGRLLKRPEDAEDIAQEAFVRVLEAGSKGKIHYPKAYLYRTAHNLALNSLALKANLLVDSMEDFPDPDTFTDNRTVEDEVVAQQRFELFCRVVAELPAQCRRVLVLRKVYGLSQKKVAERLGISVSTVEKHVAKGMMRCSARMETLENQDNQPQQDVPSHILSRSRQRQP